MIICCLKMMWYQWNQWYVFIHAMYHTLTHFAQYIWHNHHCTEVNKLLLPGLFCKTYKNNVLCTIITSYSARLDLHTCIHVHLTNYYHYTSRFFSLSSGILLQYFHLENPISHVISHGFSHTCLEKSMWNIMWQRTISHDMPQ